jgi:hypothetical protein
MTRAAFGRSSTVFKMGRVMEEGPLDIALRIANTNAACIERQQRLLFMLEETRNPLASEARHLLEIMHGIQRVAIKRLVDAEDRYGRS